MRQVVLDTETTGLEPKAGHRIIEIGCIELIDRRPTQRNYHQYINPQREIDAGALRVHGISNEFLQDKPVFADVAQTFYEFIDGAELIIHNAPFDVGFIDHEFNLWQPNHQKVKQYCDITDTLLLARKLHPGQKNNLDALCKRYDIDNTKRELHGALLDAMLLAYVYLAMTGGQVQMFGQLDNQPQLSQQKQQEKNVKLEKKYDIPVINPSTEEQEQHRAFLQRINKQAGEGCYWLALDE